MSAFFRSGFFTFTYSCRLSVLRLSAVCSSVAIIAGCSGADNDTVSNSVTSTSTATNAATLSVVKPVVDCSQLASVDLTDIGGAGSTITSATVTTTTVNALPNLAAAACAAP